MWVSKLLHTVNTKRLSRSLSSVLEVSPSSSLLDTEVTLTGRSLKPEAVVSLETRLQDTELNFDFQSVSQFLTDDRGEFSTAVDSPLPGSSYAGVHRSVQYSTVQYSTAPMLVSTGQAPSGQCSAGPAPSPDCGRRTSRSLYTISSLSATLTLTRSSPRPRLPRRLSVRE